MSMRFRRSFKVAPGVRLNVSKSGLGASFGTRGARYTMHSSGRRTSSVGIPGSGVSFVSSKGGGGRRSSGSTRQVAVQQLAAPKAPGLFAPSSEKALWRAFVREQGSIAYLEQVAQENAQARPLALMFAGIQRSSDPEARDVALTELQEIFDQGFDPQQDAFFQKYLTNSGGSVTIAQGVKAEMPVSRDLLALVLAELLQDKKKISEAITVVESLAPTSVTALSLAELYLHKKDYKKVIELSNGVKNEDDVTALLAVYRGVAFAKQELYDAALDSFKEALRFKARLPEVRLLALTQRALVNAKVGKKAQAKKDIEKVIAEDASFPNAMEILKKVS